MKKRLYRKFINIITKHLFNGITEEDIITQRKNGKVLIRGKVLDQETKYTLADQATNFRNSFLWKILRNTLQYHANQRIYTRSNSIEDIHFGKTLLYLIELIDKSLINISNLK